MRLTRARWRVIAAAFLTLWLWVCSAGADSTVRCGRGVVVTGDHLSEVLRKCGEPIFVTSFSRIVGGGYDYYGNRLPSREVIVEQLTFDFGYGKFRQTLNFENGRLTRIERGERSN